MTQVQTKPAVKAVALALLLDAALIIVFAASGRSSHAESLGVAGVLGTAWPFLAALGIGWLASRTWRHPFRLWPTGVCVWLITVAGGMALRIASGSTAAIPFVVVATLVLALFLLGQRAVVTLLMRRTQR
ncbi:DUF3054 domain-containing protein [Specibacter sp. RAF43]|uniref:DUF3054 domain-containing protein n=1 Tax=Specibacter sp. RAF43 TaxID=3233057 RepID=UPI003F9C0A34